MVEIRNAATVCIFREHDANGLEVLLLKRNEQLKFAPGVWVFPGGRIEDADMRETSDVMAGAIVAAQRETLEETGLDIIVDPDTHYYHWTTPVGGPRRFATWFFHALIEDKGCPVRIDNSEIVDYSWVQIEDIFTTDKNRAQQLLPPTYITLQRLKEVKTYQDVIDEFGRTGPITVSPRVSYTDGVFCSLYPGDSGYADVDPQQNDILHRLTGDMLEGKYRFHYSNECSVPSITGGVMF